MKYSRKRQLQWVAGIIDGCQEVMRRGDIGAFDFIVNELADAADIVAGECPIDSVPYEAARLRIHAVAGGMREEPQAADYLYAIVVGGEVPGVPVVSEMEIPRICGTCMYDNGFPMCHGCHDHSHWTQKP